MCLIDNILYSFIPLGVSSLEKSPSDFPTRLLDKGELTEIFDPKMRGKDNIWVRPHPGPFVWSQIEPEEGQ